MWESRQAVNTSWYHWENRGELPWEHQRRADSLSEGLVTKLFVPVALQKILQAGSLIIALPSLVWLNLQTYLNNLCN